jgi:hypothetical protein
MRIWRDVISAKTFKLIRTEYQRLKSESNTLAVMDKLVNKMDTMHVGRARSSAATSLQVMNSTADHVLVELEDLLAQYHDIKKRLVENIPARRKMLSLISYQAQVCIEKLGFTQSDLEKRADYGVPLKDPRTGAHMFGDPKRESLARNLLTLKRRSLRKAHYLELLEEFYQKNMDDRDGIEKLFAAERQTGKDGKEIGLMPGVRMEGYDFMHRPFENHVENGALAPDNNVNAISAALLDWWDGPKNWQYPFFMFLEGTPVCLGENKENIAEVRSVTYDRKAPKLRLINFKPKLEAVSLTDNSVVNSTLGYAAAPLKAISSGSIDMAAFAWGTDKSFFICEGGFHHSSFFSGGLVRCTGMVKIVNGKITEISNNSGHYKPPVENLAMLVAYLHKKNSLSANAVAQLCGLRDNQTNLPPIVPIKDGKFPIPKN